MKTRYWILIFSLLLVLCLGASFFLLVPGEASSRAEIISHGQVIRAVDLQKDQEFTVETNDGNYNVITV